MCAWGEFPNNAALLCSHYCYQQHFAQAHVLNLTFHMTRSWIIVGFKRCRVDFAQLQTAFMVHLHSNHSVNGQSERITVEVLELDVPLCAGLEGEITAYNTIACQLYHYIHSFGLPLAGFNSEANCHVGQAASERKLAAVSYKLGDLQ